MASEDKKKPTNPEENTGENNQDPVFDRVEARLIEDEMKQSFLDYAMSVIVDRALPDARDGLKPVHRRVLYGMHELGMFHNKPYKKSARIVGDVLGKYHPHGDSAVYETMVRMAQDFSLRYPLVNGQGNWGSIDGDSAAAMRYTEARLQRIAEEMLIDIEKETVNFVDNFDGSLKEPSVLPSKIPNLLINGSSGIAVGMATNIPPHNITETCDAIITLIKKPESEFEDLMIHVKGPDFPTGGIILGDAGIRLAYKTGEGKVKVRAKTTVEERAGRKKIIVSEIPYMVNKSALVEQIADLVKDKVITDISDLRDESDREGMRIVIELKKDGNDDVVLNQLFKHSRMQVTFGINMLALVGREPKTLGLVEMMREFILHRKEVIRRRTEFDLKKAQEKAHILEGLKIALSHIDKIIALIKSADTVEHARERLVSEYSLSKEQAQAILDLRLQKLTSLEQSKIIEELKELVALIHELKSILSSEEKILGIIVGELEEMKQKYGDKRKTQIVEGLDDEIIDFEDLIEEHSTVVTITRQGYIKRIPLDTYKQQNRGGKGIIATEVREGDFVEKLFVASTHSYILFFTDKGQVHWLKVYNIPEGSRQSMGKAIVNLIEISAEEKVTVAVPIMEFDDKRNLIMATKKGIVKKTNLIHYSRPRKGGIKAIILDDDDKLISVVLTSGKDQILLATKDGLAVKFSEEDARPIGRTARGVIGVRLKDDDEVIGMVIADDSKTILTVTENGFGKRSQISEYRLINRGGSGVINIKCSERNGKVVSILDINDDDEIMFISKNGIVIRTSAGQISTIGRNTQGLTLMKFKSEDDVVVAAAKVYSDDKKDVEKINIQTTKKITITQTKSEHVKNPTRDTESDDNDLIFPQEKLNGNGNGNNGLDNSTEDNSIENSDDNSNKEKKKEVLMSDEESDSDE